MQILFIHDEKYDVRKNAITGILIIVRAET